MSRVRQAAVIAVLAAAVTVAACGGKKPAIPAPAPQPAPGANGPAPPVVSATPPAPPGRVDDALPVPPQPLPDETVSNRAIDDLNREGVLKPVLFGLDSADLDESGRMVATANADVLRRNPTWVITVEGHCDERGTAEYNLALGERRATAVRTYLISLGIPAERVRTVSYGKEFPFDPGHTEEAWAQNRRGHFVITSR